MTVLLAQINRGLRIMQARKCGNRGEKKWTGSRDVE